LLKSFGGDILNTKLRQYIKLLYTYLKPQLSKVIILFLILAVGISIQLINPQIVRYFIDEALKGTTGKGLYTAAGAFILFATLQQFINLISTYLSQNIGWITTNNLRVDLIKHCLNLDMSFHKEHLPGEIMERVDGDVNLLFNFFSKFIINIINNLFLIIGILIILFNENWLIGLSITLFAIFTLIVLWKNQASGVDYWVEDRKANSDLFGFLGENLSSTEDIRSSNAVNFVMNKFYTLLKNWLPIRIKAIMMYYKMWTTSIIVFAIGNIVAFGVGFYLKSSGFITLGTVYLIFNYTELLRVPLEQIRGQFEDLQKSAASITRINDLLSKKSALVEGIKKMRDEDLVSISVKDLCFEYENDVPVLNNVSFNLEQGRTLGILGRTGSGKSTLAKLMIRLYDPTSGSIFLKDSKIQEYSFKALRDSIAFITQDVQLFNATVRDNLTLFNPQITDAEIYASLDSIGLKTWINSMKGGLDAVLGPEGVGLSSGEAQLLAFTRVFLKNPKLIIMDEASSRLDPATEQLMESALNKLLEGRSSIIIAHRLHTVQRADNILILEEGSVKEYGQRVDLASDINSYFYKLLKVGLEEVLA
jgi:ATP-binding cassette subfamily B protein